MEGQEASSSWLWRENLEDEDAKALATNKAHKETKLGKTVGERGAMKVLRFKNPEVVKRQIKTICKVGKEEFIRGHLDKALKIGRERTLFKGIQQLEKAAVTGEPPLLRKGQVVFGTVSLAHAQDKDGTIR